MSEPRQDPTDRIVHGEPAGNRPPAPSTPGDPASGPSAAGAFHTAMVHLYRGEMQRLTVWRTRLDTTTHWAIILTTGLTTFVLGAREVPHYIMLLGLAFNTIFMLIEGRRYQHLHHSRWRIQLLEREYFAGHLTAAPPREGSWRAQLRADLVRPHATLSHAMGIRLRLRRNYLMLAYFVTTVWLTKVFIHPASPGSVHDFYGRLAVGELFPSWFVALTAGCFVVGVTVLAALTPSEEALDQRTQREQARASSAT